MKNDILITVLICTYNSEWKKTKNTLDSILMQKEALFEIVIADDGSKIKNFDKIREYFEQRNFLNYVLVENSQNKGTVENIITGLNVAKGEYVKPISPGDYLYDELVLKVISDNIKKNDATIYFGTAIYYSNDSGGLHIYSDKGNPFDLRPYLKDDIKRIKKNYIYNGDSILGATLIYNKSQWLICLNSLKSIIKYTEDLSVLYMITNGAKIKYIANHNVIWYEWGTGISTSRNNKWEEIIVSEYKKVYIKLIEDKLLPKHILYTRFPISTNKLKKTLIYLFLDPNLFIMKLFGKRTKLKGYNIDYNIELLKKYV